MTPFFLYVFDIEVIIPGDFLELFLKIVITINKKHSMARLVGIIGLEPMTLRM